VDDNATSQEVLCAILKSFSFRVTLVDSGEQALDGLEATRRIRTVPGGDQVKIVAFTASVMEEERKSIVAAGCDDFMCKPYLESQLFEVMAKHLGVKYHYEENPSEIAIESEIDMSSLPAGLRDALTRAVL
jgi:CheY-like chemotaxis protein